MKGVCVKTIHDLHLKCGSWIRIAPSEIFTSDRESIVPIYGVSSDYIKTEFYMYQLRGIPELFTMADRKHHATRRRQLSHLFSISTITEYEPVITKQVKTRMDFIAGEDKTGRVSNLYDWWHYLFIDLICELFFGLTLNLLQDGASNAYIKDFYGSLHIEPVRWHFGSLNKYAAWAPLKLCRMRKHAAFDL